LRVRFDGGYRHEMLIAGLGGREARGASNGRAGAGRGRGRGRGERTRGRGARGAGAGNGRAGAGRGARARGAGALWPTTAVRGPRQLFTAAPDSIMVRPWSRRRRPASGFSNTRNSRCTGSR